MSLCASIYEEINEWMMKCVRNAFVCEPERLDVRRLSDNLEGGGGGGGECEEVWGEMFCG